MKEIETPKLSPDLDKFIVNWIKRKGHNLAVSIDQNIITQAYEDELEKSNG